MGKDVSLLEEVSSKFTEETLKNILIKVTESKSAKVSGWEFEPGSTKGDNYLSIVYRVTINGVVDGKNTSVKVIIKGLPHNEASKKTFRSAEFFRNEINFYSKVIPEIDRFLKSKQNYTLPVPRCLEYFCDGDNDYIVLEDVRELGYGHHTSRHDTWKPEDIQVVLKCLARFHAISFAYKDQHPSEFAEIAKNLSETYFSERHWSWYERLFTNSVNVAKDAISKEYKDTPEEQKFTSLSAQYLWERALSCMPSENAPTSIITQGDSWPANFMVRMTKTEEREAILLDFQLARCGSLVIDISNFLCTSTNKEVRDKHFNSLLKYFHDQLSDFISLLGSDPKKVFPWDLFMKEMKEKFCVGFCFSLEALPVMLLDDSEVCDTEDISGTEGVNVAEIIKIRPLESKKERRRLADMVVYVIQSGFL